MSRSGNGRQQRHQGSGGARRSVRRGIVALVALLMLSTMTTAGAASRAGAASQPGQMTTAIAWPVRLDVELQHLRTETTITVDGANRVARFEIQEQFRNVGGRLLEADYLYPVPKGAVFTDLSLFAGETELKGEMLPAEEARGIYEEIVRRRKDPALVELVGQGLVRARVFPIEPGQTRKVILRYAQVLPREADVVRLRYPANRGLMVPLDQPEPMPRERPIETPQRERRFAPDTVPFALRVRLTGADRYGTPFSPSHTIQVHRRGGDELEIAVPSAEGRSDFELLLPLARREIGASLLAHSPDPTREAGYFMLLLTPPPYEGGERIPRDVTLVLDLSGSMSGHKVLQARGALRTVLEGLDEGDRFRLITFASVVREFHSEALPATRDNVAEAVRYLEALEPDGSTNIHDALVRALEPEAQRGRMAVVLFLTDGLPTVSETDPERISAAAARLRDGERVFAFGVGEDVNTYLLDRLAEGGRGSVAYVRPDEDVEASVASLSRKIGTPALADLRIVDAPTELEELYPSPLPDLFHGEELVLLGRYRDAAAGPLVIEGERSGRTERLTFDLDFPGRRADDGFVARLWAARKAGALTSHIRLHGPDPETVAAIRELGLRYGILTEYTAYLVQEPALANMDVRQVEARVREMVAEPQAQTGSAAFRRSRAAAELDAAVSLDAAEEALAASPAMAGEWTHDGSALGPQRLGRRLFVLRDGSWQDLGVAASEGGAELAVEPYSDAWFDLLVRFPGLRAAAALGERVIIAGEGLTLRLEAGGRTRLEARDWSRLEAAFAGDR